jgi:hypothetical protein
MARQVSFLRRFIPASAFDKACESSSGCRSDVDIKDILFRPNRLEL